MLLAAAPVADLNPSPAGSYPDWVTDAGGTVYFAAYSPGGEGRELWRTDGTADGTRLVKDLFPGPQSSDPSIAYLNGKVFVLAQSKPYSRELWATDGTEAGTVLLTDVNLNTGAGDQVAANTLTPFNGFVFFWASDPEDGWRLWKSDGTRAGTVPVKDMYSGPDRAQYDGTLVEFNGRLYFAARDDDSGFELWATDGTDAGTVRIKDINPGPATSMPQSLAVADGTLLFRAYDAAHGEELWRTDGTEAGTGLLKDIAPGPASSYPANLTRSGARVFFTARSSPSSPELWVSDGTAEGTFVVVGAQIGLMRDVNGTLYYAPSGPAVYGLWKTDGTPAGTSRVAVASASDLVDLHGTIVFQSGTELWALDGNGAVMLRNFDRPADLYAPVDRLTVSGDTVFFAAYTTAAGRELWKTDGTPQGTVLIRDINPGPEGSEPARNTTGSIPPFPPLRLTPSAGGTVYFSASTPDLGWELWKSDGTEAGTVPLDVISGTGDSNPYALSDDHGTLYFAARAGPTGLYRVGPGSTTIEPLASPEAIIQEVVVSGGTIYLSAAQLPNPWALNLWASDGTAGGTRFLHSFNNFFDELTDVNGTIFFDAGPAGRGRALWKTNGTDGGTVLVKDFGEELEPRHLVNFNGTLYFAAGDAEHGRELWKSDGTPEGTVLLRDIVPGAGSSGPDRLVAVGGTLFFRARTPAGTELWKSDGTEAGTVRVAALSPRPPEDEAPPPARYYYSSPAAAPARFGAGLNGVLIFADGGPDGTELWRSDGTEAGTVRVKDINPGPGGSDPADFVEYAGRIYFSANDPAAGRELWSTDGTPEGTTRAQDIYPGPVGSSPTSLTPSGDALYFSATGHDVGRELWKYTPAAPVATVVGRHVFYNHSSYDGNDAEANAADDNAIATDKNALLAGQDRLPGFDNVTSFDKGLNGVMIDVANLPIIDALLDANDFEFSPAGNAPVSVTVRPGAGTDGSDRVTLIWRDYNPLDLSPLPQAVANGWLTVTMKANAHTGLAAPDVFSLGNLIAETGDAGGALGWRVNAIDLAAVKHDLNAPTTITARSDFNRDGRVNALDVATVKKNLSHSLPIPIPIVPLATAAPPRRVDEEVLS